jgi:hypothetical protein
MRPELAYESGRSAMADWRGVSYNFSFEVGARGTRSTRAGTKMPN